ncbi:HAMP domain-containing histidine kinase [Candidatus Sulfurimonas marisnigri]|uniref:histidine kinase n=1 Tax=Candidatus Sulfurimonas marisnigri TaxID=2740405 RepID=A0A7S7M2D4_9BACT|nr:HAMP domain-containing sensor histidine kinase [Candidatus Sulfurimonas marisnigri]QOY55278.1 HAMP domain-containing histidine kinase [Candidatus Sulfurimonas marisnigri]
MFRNLKIHIFIYYFVTTATFLGILYYFLNILHVENNLLIVIVLLTLLTFSGFIIAKLSVEPLFQHVTNLQNLSKETLHELNLPISTIKTNLHMLKKSLSDEKDLKRAIRIESACDMLQQRYNELDYMIKLQSSNVAKENFSLDELLRQRVEFLKSIYPHVEFKLNLQPTQIHSDKVGLSKVIDNLIDNGVKYSQNIHKIDVELQDYSLHVKDYGCGMDEVELVQIFDNYYQSNENMQGFGIGLSMVKRFCDSNEVLLNLKSEPDNGTTIILKFKED